MKAANKLRELYMDNVLFFVTGSDIDAISDLDTEDEVVSTTFLFHACSSKVLERVSMRNTKIRPYWVRPIRRTVATPQSALIKFIRKAPTSLRWFQSNLNSENIAMLQKERPEIEFVSKGHVPKLNYVGRYLSLIHI